VRAYHADGEDPNGRQVGLFHGTDANAHERHVSPSPSGEIQ
jgi:hypothetical protein